MFPGASQDFLWPNSQSYLQTKWFSENTNPLIEIERELPKHTLGSFALSQAIASPKNEQVRPFVTSMQLINPLNIYVCQS